MLCIKLENIKSRLGMVQWLWDQGIVNQNVWLAGGSLRTVIDPKDKVVDYDLFFKENTFYGQTQVTDTRNKLIQLGFKLTFECPEGKLYSYTLPKDWCIVCNCKVEDHHRAEQFRGKEIKVQLICENFYQAPEHLLSEFDLTPTQFCTDGRFLWTTKRAIKAVKNKTCELVKLTYPVATINRLFKYRNKGYEINCAIQEVVSNLVGRTDILNSDSLRVYID